MIVRKAHRIRKGDLEIYLANPFREYPHFLEIRRLDELYVPCVAIHLNKNRANCTREKANIDFQGIISMPHSSHSAAFKDMKVCEAIHRDACSDHQATSALLVDFLDVGEQVAGPWFSPYQSMVRIYGDNQGHAT
ncbi:hypothetical protein TNCV_950871 [Trichonephila clavipes]|nr:hypothetical protein TNCV_950871 [Trichonephila clavipes]